MVKPLPEASADFISAERPNKLQIHGDLHRTENAKVDSDGQAALDASDRRILRPCETRENFTFLQQRLKTSLGPKFDVSLCVRKTALAVPRLGDTE
jgi:hypothetical protein